MAHLRPYQIEALESTRTILSDKDSTLIVLPTGTGKTIIAAKLLSEWEQGNTLFLAHTRELIQQSADKLGAELGFAPVVEMSQQGGDPRDLYQGGLVVVGSVQSMINDRRLNKYKDHSFGLICIDEAHRATSAGYRKVIDFFREINPRTKVVGITATPNRTDGTALGTIFDSVAFRMSIEEAIDEGWLVPIRQEVVTITGLDFTGVKLSRTKDGEQDFREDQLEAVLVEEENLHGMAVASLEKVGERPTIVFTAGVRHANLFADVLNRYRLGSAKAVSGVTDAEERKRTLRDFNEGRLQFVANCQVLTEGYDAPACASIVMGKPTKSLLRYVQMLGRGLRPLAGVVDGPETPALRKDAILASGKNNCLVLDYVGVSNHKLIDAVDVLGGTYDLDTREIARKAAGTQKDLARVLELAQHLARLKREFRERQEIRARDVKWESYEEDPFDGSGGVSGRAQPKVRGGCSDAQIGLLVSLGVKWETAAGYSKRQAGAVIDSMGKSHCTSKQAKVLRRAGIDPAGVGLDRASRIIDAIAKNGWKRPEVIPQ